MITPVLAAGVHMSWDTLELVLEMARDAQRWQRRTGRPRPEYSQLAAILMSLRPSVDGQTDIHTETARQAEGMAIDEAAELLGLSERHVRRMARELGGRKVGRSWLLDRAAVAEHKEGSL